MPKKPAPGASGPPGPAPGLAPTPATTDAARGVAPTTQVTPVAEKIGEGPGNLKAREAAFKRRTGQR